MNHLKHAFFSLTIAVFSPLYVVHAASSASVQKDKNDFSHGPYKLGIQLRPGLSYAGSEYGRFKKENPLATPADLEIDASFPIDGMLFGGYKLNKVFEVQLGVLGGRKQSYKVSSSKFNKDFSYEFQSWGGMLKMLFHFKTGGAVGIGLKGEQVFYGKYKDRLTHSEINLKEVKFLKNPELALLLGGEYEGPYGLLMGVDFEINFLSFGKGDTDEDKTHRAQAYTSPDVSLILGYNFAPLLLPS